MSLQNDLATLIHNAIAAAQSTGTLPEFDIPEIVIERPRDLTKGDFATATALKLAKPARMAPIKIAEAIAENIGESDAVAEISVAHPGFINIRLSTTYTQSLVDKILADNGDYGRVHLGDGQKAQIEFVSANPTGPITLGRTRGGVMGDTLARLMEMGGYDVTREYYYNDAGRQIQLLGESVKIRYQQLTGQEIELTKEHYQGEYIKDIAQEILDVHGTNMDEHEPKFFGDIAKDTIMIGQKKSLESIGIKHDVFYNENDLYTSGRMEAALEILRKNGYAYDSDDGAVWLKTTAMGDDQDRVLVRSIDKMPTYRYADIAYHQHKVERGFDLVVDIFGPDHHAVAPQVLQGVQMLGHDTSFVRTVLHQIVSLIKDGEAVKMSTRAGKFVTLDELVEWVGADPIRYFILNRSGNSEVVFDLDLALEKSDRNPVYYIQNAHVRCAGIFRKWAEAGHDEDADKDADLSLLTDEKVQSFLKKSLELSEVIKTCVESAEPHHIAFYAYELAAAFHPAYESARVLHTDVSPELALARLKFYRSAKTLFAHVLDLMGMSAPEFM